MKKLGAAKAAPATEGRRESVNYKGRAGEIMKYEG
jgi:hypothetical protein